MEVNLYNFIQVLATSSGRDSGTSGHLENDPDGDTRLNFGDAENMVSSSKASSLQDYAFDSTSINTKREKHLRYRTRVFAAEYVNLLLLWIFKVIVTNSILLHTYAWFLAFLSCFYPLLLLHMYEIFISWCLMCITIIFSPFELLSRM